MAFTGGSLVSNILQRSSDWDQKYVENCTQKLAKKATQLKQEMYEHIREKYVDFETHGVQSSAHLLEATLQEVADEHRRLSSSIDGDVKRKLAESAEKRREIEENLRGTEEKLEFVRRMSSIHQNLQTSRKQLEEKRFLEAAHSLEQVSECLNGLNELGCEAMVFTQLRNEFVMVVSEATLTLSEEWEQQVSFTPELSTSDGDELPPYHVMLTTELIVPASQATNTGVSEWPLSVIVSSCQSLNIWSRMRVTFSKRLFELFVKPLVLTPTLAARCTVESARNSAVLSLEDVEDGGKIERISKLYKNLSTVFNFVDRVVPGEKDEWMSEIGKSVCPQMADLILECCLKSHIPQSEEELEKYELVKEATTDFEAELEKLGLVDEGFNALSQFTENIDVYFEELRQQELLAKARSILQKSIHEVEKIVPPEGSEIKYTNIPSPGDVPESREGKPVTEKDLMLDEDKLRDVGAQFPACTVSKCIVEYVEFLREILQAGYAKEDDKEKMEAFSRVRELIDLYRAVFPSHHKEAIDNIPAAAAVYYNNCMFFVHQLILESAELPKHLSPHATFVDIILILRKLGESAFQLEMRKQRSSVLNCLKTFGNFRGVSEDDKKDEVYRGVQQGLYQISQLSRVYKDTLPSHVHRDAVGNLLDVLSSYIVQGILALEDIVSNDSSELSELIGVVVVKGVEAMQLEKKEAEEELPHRCPSWTQLKELAFVLDARMQDIVDRWGKGKGSLAKHFKATQIRTLIKALFTNTDRRAAAIDKITL